MRKKIELAVLLLFLAVLVLLSKNLQKLVSSGNVTAKNTEIAIIEVGGTVGDIESQPFLEAIRQFQHDVGRENAILIHVTLIP